VKKGKEGTIGLTHSFASGLDYPSIGRARKGGVVAPPSPHVGGAIFPTLGGRGGSDGS